MANRSSGKSIFVLDIDFLFCILQRLIFRVDFLVLFTRSFLLLHFCEQGLNFLRKGRKGERRREVNWFREGSLKN